MQRDPRSGRVEPAPGGSAYPDAPTLDEQRRRNRRRVLIVAAVASLASLIWLVPAAERERDERTPMCMAAKDLLAPGEERADTAPATITYLRSVVPVVTVGNGDPSERDIPSPQALAEGRRDGDFWIDVATDKGFRGGYERWESGELSGGGQVLQFESHDGALAFQREATMYSCRFAAEVFRVPGAADAVGLQIRYTSGAVSDQATFVRGSRRYLVWIDGNGSPPPRDKVLYAAETAAFQAV